MSSYGLLEMVLGFSNSYQVYMLNSATAKKKIFKKQNFAVALLCLVTYFITHIYFALKARCLFVVCVCVRERGIFIANSKMMTHYNREQKGIVFFFNLKQNHSKAPLLLSY